MASRPAASAATDAGLNVRPKATPVSTDPSGTDEHDQPQVVSLGSVNLDRVHEVTAADLQQYEREYDWFPAADETVRVESAPDFGEPDELHHGGKGANQAVAAAAAGARTTLLGKVGPDAERAGVLDALRTARVSVEHLGRADAPTGTAHVFREPGGENRIVVVGGANDRVDEPYLRDVVDVVRGADCLLLQNEIPPDPVVTLLDWLAAGDGGPTVVYDPAPATGAEALLDHPAVDCCTPNEREYEQLRAHFETFDGTIVRRQGPDDVVVEQDGRELFRVTPPSVPVRDTTGAGDVFTGFLGTCLARGEDRQEAVETAVVAASLAIREPGAREGIPSPAEVRAFGSRD